LSIVGPGLLNTLQLYDWSNQPKKQIVYIRHLTFRSAGCLRSAVGLVHPFNALPFMDVWPSQII
jgi:hypothetical protein